MPSSHLMLWSPLFLLPSIFPSIRDFSNELAVCIRRPKYWSFSLSISLPNFPGSSGGKASVYNAGDLGSIPGSGRSPEDGNGNPLQDSCLENPVDREAWWATVHRATKGRTQLNNFTYLASASVLPMRIQSWFPLRLTGLSPCCPRDSQEASPVPQFKDINSLELCLLYGPALITVCDYSEDHCLDYMHFCWESDVSAFQHTV